MLVLFLLKYYSILAFPRPSRLVIAGDRLELGQAQGTRDATQLLNLEAQLAVDN